MFDKENKKPFSGNTTKKFASCHLEKAHKINTSSLRER